MDDRTDFSIGEDGRTRAVETPTAPPPVIVIEYRRRGLAARLLPPALILMAALAVSSYRRTTPIRPPGPGYKAPSGSWTPPTTTTTDPATTKIIVRAETRAPRQDNDNDNEAAEVGSPAPAPAPRSPFELSPVDGLRPLPPAPEPGPEPASTAGPEPAVTATPPGAPETITSPEPPPVAEPSKEEILRDIQREADEKAAQRHNLADLKPRARRLLQAEAVAKIQADRVPFRNDLRQILKQRGDDSGPEIDRLCTQYGRTMLPEVRKAYNRALAFGPTRANRQWMVETMRAVGIPEPVILDYLANKLDKSINTRGGPRDQDGVRILAAKTLLGIPVVPSRKTATSPAVPGASARP